MFKHVEKSREPKMPGLTAQHAWPGQVAEFFFKSPSLTACNFVAL